MITIHVGARSTRSGKEFAWMWSTKNKKLTWGKSEGTETLAEIFAIISALNKLSAYSQHDIVFKTSKQEIVKLIEKPSKSNHTAILQLRQAIYLWKGKVKVQYVHTNSQDEGYRHVMTTLNKLVDQKLSKEPKKPKEMDQRIIELAGRQRNEKVLKKPTVKPRKKTREVLVSFFDDDDAPKATLPPRAPSAPKPVVCTSCNGIINVYTNECRCSA